MVGESNLHSLSSRLLTACKQGSLSTVRSIAPVLYAPSSSSASKSPLSWVVAPIEIALATAAKHGQAPVLHYLLTSVPSCSTSPTPWQPLTEYPSPLPEEWKEAHYSDLVVLRAVESSSTSVVQTLLDAGMKVDHQIDKIGTPLGVAILRQSVEMVTFLLDKGANANEIGWMPPISFLARAASLPSRDILIALLDHGAKSSGSGALFMAAETGNIPAVEVLLDRGMDVDEVMKMELFGDERDNLGTALHAATEHEQAEMILYLLNKGARRDLKNGEGNTPRDVAQKGGKSEIVKIFDEAM